MVWKHYHGKAPWCAGQALELELVAGDRSQNPPFPVLQICEEATKIHPQVIVLLQLRLGIRLLAKVCLRAFLLRCRFFTRFSRV